MSDVEAAFEEGFVGKPAAPPSRSDASDAAAEAAFEKGFNPKAGRPDGGDTAGFDDLRQEMKYRPLNLLSLLDAGAVRITQPGNGKDGGFEASDDPNSWSLVTLFNDMHPAAPTKAWPDKPEAHQSAIDAINKPGPLYDGKYRQILWSAYQKGLTDDDIFLADAPRDTGMKRDK